MRFTSWPVADRDWTSKRCIHWSGCGDFTGEVGKLIHSVVVEKTGNIEVTIEARLRNYVNLLGQRLSQSLKDQAKKCRIQWPSTKAMWAAASTDIVDWILGERGELYLAWQHCTIPRSARLARASL